MEFNWLTEYTGQLGRNQRTEERRVPEDYTSVTVTGTKVFRHGETSVANAPGELGFQVDVPQPGLYMVTAHFNGDVELDLGGTESEQHIHVNLGFQTDFGAGIGVGAVHRVNLHLKGTGVQSDNVRHMVSGLVLANDHITVGIADSGGSTEGGVLPAGQFQCDVEETLGVLVMPWAEFLTELAVATA